MAGVVYLEDKGLTERLDELRRRGTSAAPAMAEIAEMFVGRVSEEFDTAGHGRWPKLAASTLRKRRMGGAGAQPLKDTGRAAASIRAEHTETSAEAATDVEYMVYHCSDAPRTIIPLRNPFDIPDDAFDEATDILLSFVVGSGG